MIQVEIVNVVGRIHFQRELELTAIAELLTGNDYVQEVRYEPAENHWLQTWIDSPIENSDRYVSFYRSGAAMVTGCASIREFESMADRVELVMNPVVDELDVQVTREIKNIVALGTVDNTFNLSMLALSLGFDVVEYEPEQFPGLIYRDHERSCVFLVFASGKIICTGLRETDATESALHSFAPQILTE